MFKLTTSFLLLLLSANSSVEGSRASNGLRGVQQKSEGRRLMGGRKGMEGMMMGKKGMKSMASSEDDSSSDENLMNIVELAIGSPDLLSTLVGVLSTPEQSVVLETLQSDGPFTVFAPTNDAFAAVDLSPLSPSGISNVLQYHVLPDEVTSKDIKSGVVAAANGNPLLVDVSENGVKLNGMTNVIAADLEASNGVVHVIDGVLMPPASSIVGVVASDKDTFSTLETAVQTAGLVEALQGAGPFTVFAPTNAAFAKLGQETIDNLLQNPEQLKAILLYHVTGGLYGSGDLQGGKVATLNDGAKVTVDVGNGVVLNGESNVIVADVLATNAVIHVIDTVLIPPSS